MPVSRNMTTADQWSHHHSAAHPDGYAKVAV